MTTLHYKTIKWIQKNLTCTCYIVYQFTYQLTYGNHFICNMVSSKSWMPKECVKVTHLRRAAPGHLCIVWRETACRMFRLLCCTENRINGWEEEQTLQMLKHLGSILKMRNVFLGLVILARKKVLLICGEFVFR